jgi:hypothetical protein
MKCGPIEFFDRRGNGRRITELDEGEASRRLRCPIHGQDHLDDLANLGKQRLKVLLCCLVAQITHEHS